MFRRTTEPGPTVAITVDGVPVTARVGETVAAALLAMPKTQTRTTPVLGSPRAPYCMMGVCFDCLVTIDGIGNRQGCLVPVADGMVIERQVGPRGITR